MSKRKHKARATRAAQRRTIALPSWMGLAVYTMPRLLGILFALYMASFAWGAFDRGLPLLEMIGDLLIKLMPAYVVAGALVVAWRNELRGGLLFLGVAILFAVWFGQAGNNATLAAFVGPSLWTGLGFLAAWWLGATHARRAEGS